MLIALKAQDNWSIVQLRDDSTGWSAGIRGEGLLNASQVDNAFLWAFLTGGFIENDVKDRILDRTADKHYSGGDLNSGVFVNFPLQKFLFWDSTNFQSFVSISDRLHFDLAYTSDALKLALYGNKSFAGSTANLDGALLNSFRYQQLQWGLFHQGEKMNWGLGLSLINGEDYFGIDVDRLRLFTSEIGDSLHLTTKGTFLQSDTNNTSLLSQNGIGFGVDLFFEKEITLPLPDNFGATTVQLEVRDLGMIGWNSSSIEGKMDTAFDYTGIVLEDIFDINDSILNNSNPDTIWDDLQNNIRSKAYSTPLPATIAFSVQQKISQKSTVSLGFQQRLWAQSRPYIWARETYRFFG